MFCKLILFLVGCQILPLSLNIRKLGDNNLIYATSKLVKRGTQRNYYT
jgi:hypothetical protein